MGIRVNVRFKCWGAKWTKWARGMKKKFSGAFGATICMASSYLSLVTKWARRAGRGGGRVPEPRRRPPRVRVMKGDGGRDV